MPIPPKNSTGCALITGASSGIGEAFARRLAADGYDVILVARRKDRLEALADRLAKEFGVRAQALRADLSTLEGVETVEQVIANAQNLALLVNNAGFGEPGLFTEHTLQSEIDMLRVHIEAVVRLTHAALPGMISRRRGGIINVSSVAAYLPSRGNVNYSATKAYLNNFSEALQLEVADDGLQVQALCPGFTATEFHETPVYLKRGFKRSVIPGFLWMPAEKVVEKSLSDLRRRRVICIPGLKYQWIVRFARSGIFRPIVRIVSARLRKR
jgi:hypothetical protein